MNARTRHGGLGFGGAVGLGVAAALLIGVITMGHAIFGQLKGAASTVLVFAEVAACVILGGAVLGVLGLLAYRGQLARLHLAERRLALEQLARQAPAGQLAPGASWAARAEVLQGGAEGGPSQALTSGNANNGSPAAVLSPKRPVIQAERRPTVLGLTRSPGRNGGDS